MGYSLHLAHLYGDLLNTYGDIGNVLVLEYYAKQMGIEFTSEIVSIEQDFDEKKFDLAFFGGGQDFEQTIVSKDIQRMKESLTTFIEDDGPMLAICGGYQLLGQYYIGAHGERIEGIHALSHHTESQINHRFIGVISGNGNNGSDKTEGAIYKNVCCSYFHGPILARNGLLAKRLLLAALKRKYPNDDFSKQEALEIKATY